MLGAGANVNLRNGNGDTPLHLARDGATVNVLLDAGALTVCVRLGGTNAVCLCKRKAF